MRKLLSGALDRETVNKLLISRHFPLLTKSISAYLKGSAEEGIRVQNEIMNLAIQGLKREAGNKKEIFASNESCVKYICNE